MHTLFAMLADPTVFVGIPATLALSWGVRELISIRERLSRIETELKLRRPKDNA